MPEHRPSTILFVCRHGAAKSVLAAELASRRAAEHGLRIAVAARGLDPEPVYAPQLGVAIPGFAPTGAPRRLTADDAGSADIVITFDLDPDELPGQEDALRWDGLPAVSQDPLGARRAIEERVARLLPGRSAD